MSQATTDPAVTPSEQQPEQKRPFYTKLSFQIVVGLIAGLVLGFVAVALGTVGENRDPNWLTTLLTEVGKAYVSLLTVLVIPLVVTAVISSVARLRQVANAARLFDGDFCLLQLSLDSLRSREGGFFSFPLFL